MAEKICQTCATRYKDGFCMQHCYYTNDEDTCSEWSSEPLRFSYDRIYNLCKDFIKICKDYEEYKELCIKYPEDIIKDGSFEFFFNCCLNDLHREMSLWRTKK